MGKHYETNWTKEKIFEVARQYKTRSEFKNEYSNAYRIACKSGLIYEMDWFNTKRKPRGYWTKERVFEAGKKCNTKKEFENKYNGAYQKAHEYGWIDEMDWFEDGNIKKLTDKIDCIYIYHFKESNSVYVGRTIRPVDRDLEHRRYKKYGKENTDTVFRYSKENGFEIPKMEIIEDNLSVIEGQEREGYWVEYYREKGYNIINRMKVGKGSGSIGAIGRGKWNRQTLKVEANKYKGRSDFLKYASGAYDAARRYNLLDELFPKKCVG